MSISIAPSPWPASAAAPAPWRFGREVWLTHDGGNALALQWLMRRNCSLAPSQMLGVYLALCAVSLGIGAGFWLFGAPAILPFAGAELLLLGAALWLYSRHALDRETITLAQRRLQVEHHCGRRTVQASFRAEWVCVEPAHGEGSLVELTGQGQRIRVGRYLRPELRAALARELRQALRRERGRFALDDTNPGQQR